jgi:hypothetical protein
MSSQKYKIETNMGNTHATDRTTFTEDDYNKSVSNMQIVGFVQELGGRGYFDVSYKVASVIPNSNVIISIYRELEKPYSPIPFGEAIRKQVENKGLDEYQLLVIVVDETGNVTNSSVVEKLSLYNLGLKKFDIVIEKDVASLVKSVNQWIIEQEQQ